MLGQSYHPPSHLIIPRRIFQKRTASKSQIQSITPPCMAPIKVKIEKRDHCITAVAPLIILPYNSISPTKKSFGRCSMPSPSLPHLSPSYKSRPHKNRIPYDFLNKCYLPSFTQYPIHRIANEQARSNRHGDPPNPFPKPGNVHDMFSLKLDCIPFKVSIG